MPWAMRRAGSPSGTPTTGVCWTNSASAPASASPASSISAGRPSRPRIASGRRSRPTPRTIRRRGAHDPEKWERVFGKDHAPNGKSLMFYEPDKRDAHVLPHDPFKAIVAPRPIGWITSTSLKGEVNCAPYSYFNGINSKPTLVMFASEGHKDSVSFIEETGEFVCNLAT